MIDFDFNANVMSKFGIFWKEFFFTVTNLDGKPFFIENPRFALTLEKT